ncbi:MAG: hypothetical protein GY788_02640 [bacterium]|nr:hypothetical protein [bacterium]
MSTDKELLTNANLLKERVLADSSDVDKRDILADLKAMKTTVDDQFNSGNISYVTWKDVWELLKEIWELLTS